MALGISKHDCHSMQYETLTILVPSHTDLPAYKAIHNKEDSVVVMRSFVLLLLVWLPVVHGQAGPDETIIVDGDSSHQSAGVDQLGAQMAQLTAVMEHATAELTRELSDLSNAIRKLSSLAEDPPASQQQAGMPTRYDMDSPAEVRSSTNRRDATKGGFMMII